MKDEPHGNDIEHLRAKPADIVERLREEQDAYELCHEAADEIERLRAVLQEIANMRYSNTSAAAIAYEASKPDFASLAVAFGNPKAPTDE